MKKAPVAVLLACISVLVCSCNKFSIGDPTVAQRSIENPFQVIEFHDDVNVQVMHCNTNHPAGFIQIKAGENLIDNISATIQKTDETVGKDTLYKLVIQNNNSTNFLHSYDYAIEATVYYDALYRLIFNSNANIQTDTLKGFNFLTHFSQDTLGWDSLAPNLLIEIEGGSGDINVSTSCYRVTTKYYHGTSNITTKGQATIASTYADYDCHGIIDNRNLESHIHYVNSYGTNTIYAKAFLLMKISNFNIGRVYYVDYKKSTWDFIPADDEHPWGHYEWVTHQCPISKDLHGDNIFPWKDQ